MSELDEACRRAGLTWVYKDGAGRMQEAPEDSRLEGDREALLEELRAERTAAAEARAAEEADADSEA